MQAHKRLLSLAIVFLTVVLTEFVPWTPISAQTAGPSSAQLEVQANLAFNRGEYKTALPILRKLVDSVKNDPAHRGVIEEKIRVCETAIASLGSSSTTQPVPASNRDRRPHPAPKPGEILDISIKELGNFEYDPERPTGLPSDVTRLNGVKIRLRGFMIPIDQAENITEFALVPSLFFCCNNAPPQIQHTIDVHCPKGKAVGYCPDEIVIEGTLTVAEKKDGEYVVSIFGVDVSSVKPAPK